MAVSRADLVVELRRRGQTKLAALCDVRPDGLAAGDPAGALAAGNIAIPGGNFGGAADNNAAVLVDTLITRLAMVADEANPPAVPTTNAQSILIGTLGVTAREAATAFPDRIANSTAAITLGEARLELTYSSPGWANKTGILPLLREVNVWDVNGGVLDNIIDTLGQQSNTTWEAHVRNLVEGDSASQLAHRKSYELAKMIAQLKAPGSDLHPDIPTKFIGSADLCLAVRNWLATNNYNSAGIAGHVLEAIATAPDTQIADQILNTILPNPNPLYAGANPFTGAPLAENVRRSEARRAIILKKLAAAGLSNLAVAGGNGLPDAMSDAKHPAFQTAAHRFDLAGINTAITTLQTELAAATEDTARAAFTAFITSTEIVVPGDIGITANAVISHANWKQQVAEARINELAKSSPAAAAYLRGLVDWNDVAKDRVGAWPTLLWQQRKDALLAGLVLGGNQTVIAALFGGDPDRLLAAAPAGLALPVAPGLQNMIAEARIAELADKNLQGAEYLRQVIATLSPADQATARNRIASWPVNDWNRNRDSLLQRLVAGDVNDIAAIKAIFNTQVVGAPANPLLIAGQVGELQANDAQEMVGNARINELAGENPKAAIYLRLAISRLLVPDQAEAKRRIGRWGSGAWDSNKKQLFTSLAEQSLTRQTLPGVFATAANETFLLAAVPAPLAPVQFSDNDQNEMVGEARIAELAIENPQAAAYLVRAIVTDPPMAKRTIGAWRRDAWVANKESLFRRLAALPATSENAVRAVFTVGEAGAPPIAALVAVPPPPPPALAPALTLQQAQEIVGDARISVLAETDEKLAAAVRGDNGWNAAAKQAVGVKTLAQWQAQQTILRGHLAAANVSENGNALKSIIGNATANSGALLGAELAVAPAHDGAKCIVGLARVTAWIVPALPAGHVARDYFISDVAYFDSMTLRTGANRRNDQAYWQAFARELADHNTTVERLSEICTEFGIAPADVIARRINAHNQFDYLTAQIEAPGPASLIGALARPANKRAILRSLIDKSSNEVDILVLQLQNQTDEDEVKNALVQLGFSGVVALRQTLSPAERLASQVVADRREFTDKIWIHNFYIQKLVDGRHLTLTKTKIKQINDAAAYLDLQAVRTGLNAQLPGLGDALVSDQDVLTADAEAIFAVKLATLPADASNAVKCNAVWEVIRDEQLRQNNYRTGANRLSKYPAFHEWFSKAPNMPFLLDPAVARPVGVPVAAPLLHPDLINRMIEILQLNPNVTHERFCKFLADPVIPAAGDQPGCGLVAAYHPDDNLFIRIKRDARLSDRGHEAFASEITLAREILAKAKLQVAATVTDPELIEANKFIKEQAASAVASQFELARQPITAKKTTEAWRAQIVACNAKIKAREDTLADLKDLEKALPKKGVTDDQTKVNIGTKYLGILPPGQNALLEIINDVAQQRTAVESNLQVLQQELLGAKKQLLESKAHQTSHQGLRNAANGIGVNGAVAYSGFSGDIGASDLVFTDEHGNATNGITKDAYIQQLQNKMKSSNRWGGFFSTSSAPPVSQGANLPGAQLPAGPNSVLRASGWPATVTMNPAAQNPAAQNPPPVAVKEGLQEFVDGHRTLAYAEYGHSGQTVTVTAADINEKDLAKVYDRASDLPLSVYHQAKAFAPANTQQPRMFITGGDEKQARKAYQVLLAKGLQPEDIDNTSAFRLERLSQSDQKKFWKEVKQLTASLALGPNAKGVTANTLKKLTEDEQKQENEVERIYGVGRLSR